MQYVFKNTYSDFPAVTHVDRTSRIQTVNKLDHPMLHELLTQFYNKTGCPMLLNTSLNIKGQPIVNDEKDVTRSHCIEWKNKGEIEIYVNWILNAPAKKFPA